MVCAICLCDIEHKVKLSCKHIFHKECIEEWQKRSNTCPLCREDTNTNIIYNICVKEYEKNFLIKKRNM